MTSGYKEMPKRNIIVRHYKLVASIILLIVLAAFIPVHLSPYYLDLFIMLIINAILAMTFIMTLRTGLLNMGISAFWGIGAYSSALLVMNAKLSFWLSLPLSALIAGIIALGLGYLLIGSGSSGFTFIVLSIVLGQLFSVVVGNISYLGGYVGIHDIPPPNPISIPFFPSIEFVSKTQYFYFALFLLVFVVLILKAFYAAWTGRAWNATGMATRLAESIGINPFRYRLLSFVIASGIAGLMGSFYAHYTGYIVGDIFSVWKNIYIQVYAIVGGIGYAILGPLVGSALMAVLPQITPHNYSVYSAIVTGIILLLVILFLPNGLLTLLEWRKVVVAKIAEIGRAIESLLPTRRKARKG